jgi:hypothetical protein
MTTKELQHKIIDRISKLEDEELLNDLMKLMDATTGENEIYHLSTAHKEAIYKATEQIKQGNYLVHEEANKQINTWLNK